MIVIPTSAYPLTWPHGVRRSTSRKTAPFWKRVHRSAGEPPVEGKRDSGDGIKKIRRELELARARTIVISSNLPLNSQGFPYSDGPQRPGGDVGVAVYWTRGLLRHDGTTGQVPYCIPCDRWDRIADNLYAIGMSIEALRGMERWGCVTVEQAFAGFAALPPGSGETANAAPVARPWRVVLGVGPELAGLAGDDLLVIARSRHRRLIADAHPDRGGDVVVAAEINAAIEAADKELAGG